MKKLFAIVILLLAVCCMGLSAPAPASAASLLYSLPSFTAQATGLTSSITGTTAAAITSGPTLTISQAGTHEVSATVTTTYSGATFAAVQSVSCSLYRTNNTPGTISYATATAIMPIITTLTAAGPTIVLPRISYTTTNANDALQVYCSVTANPGAGSVQVTSVNMLAVRYK